MTDGPSGGRAPARNVEGMRAGGAQGHPLGTPRPRRGAGPAAGRRTDTVRVRHGAGADPDARRARGERTRDAVVQALVALADERADAPTVAQVARRAGRSARSVYHHFGGMDALLLAAVARQAADHHHLLFAVPPKGPAHLRVAALCRQRRLYFEQVGPVLLLASTRADGRSAVEVRMADDRVALRLQLARTLAPELAAVGPGGPELLDALAHATGWDAWRALRAPGGRTAAAAERVMARTALGLLG